MLMDVDGDAAAFSLLRFLLLNRSEGDLPVEFLRKLKKLLDDVDSFFHGFLVVDSSNVVCLS